MNTRTTAFDKQLSKGQTAALFLACLAAPALVGWLGNMLSGMTATGAAKAPYAPSGAVSSAIWIACYAVLGISLFLTFTAEAHSGGQRMIKLWSLSLWGAMFVLSLIWPFFMYGLQSYMLSFVWLVIIDAAAVALITVNFRLRPAAAFTTLPFAAFAVFMTYAAFYVAIYI